LIPVKRAKKGGDGWKQVSGVGFQVSEETKGIVENWNNEMMG